jgi:hemolysin III
MSSLAPASLAAPAALSAPTALPAAVALLAPRVKPLLRGVSHLIAAAAAVPAVVALLWHAQGQAAQLGAAVYGGSLILLFGVSATYHRRFWSLRARRVVGRLDHAAIFLLIAGTYTPLGLLIGPGAGHRMLATVWIGAALGVALVVGWHGLGKRLRAGIYVVLGWAVAPVLPELRAAVGDGAMALFFAGGALYTVGAVIYAVRRPDPFPRTFGFHEIFHLLVIAAAACHYLVVEAAVRALGG